MKIYHNPRCSKSRQALSLLQERGVDPTIVEYLNSPPTEAEVEGLMRRLGIEDPREMMRTKEGVYREQGLGERDGSDLIKAMVQHPILMERPIIDDGENAVIGRPPEKLLALLGD